ncbi:unnamed protein product [Urochloa decumbens]|uniref:Uncharacterized protein n=1 Tax=Urochloa decumbens TaxID=240449 RepID=A0ABC9EMA4_9POAL
MAGRRRRGWSGGDGTGEGAGNAPNLSDGSRAGMDRNRRLILESMYGYYDEALAALPLERMPALAPRLLESGVCFGFGDPVTNIIANTLSALGEPACGEPVLEPDGGARSRKRKRKKALRGDARAREEILSKIVAVGDARSPPEARTIAEHSLEGLVTFLTSYFRYLPTWDALRYLRLCCADLLAAVRLIELDRCHRRQDKFCIGSHAVKVALKCAALSARLPNVDAFLTGSYALVSHLANNMPGHGLSVQDVARLSELLKKPLELKKLSIPLDLAAVRCRQYDIKVQPMLKESVRAILLDRIHAVYLKAITRFPIEDFRRCYQHGFLKAGYCYGPFNLLFNVIVNTIWYDAVFPAPQTFELDVMCTRMLIRIESRSLDGLINLLLCCAYGLSEYDGMIYLLKSNLDLNQAIEMAGKDGYQTFSCDDAAYTAAANASSHPQRKAYLHFLIELLPLPMVKSAVMKLLCTKTLSSHMILELSMLLSSSRSRPSKSLERIDELTKDALAMVSTYKEKFSSQQNFVRKKVEAALLNCEQTKEYEVRFICTVNENVGSKSFRDLKYPYSHVNFLASPEDKTCLTFFFAQVSNLDEDSEHHRSFCRPVSTLTSSVRCCYCEFEATRIVHPVESYCGGFMDFEKMATGRHTLTNARIISHGELIACPVGILEEECIYFDPGRDAKFIQAMNKTAWAANLNWGDEIRRVKQTGALQMDATF